MLLTIEGIVRYLVYGTILLIAWLLISPGIVKFLRRSQTNRRYRGIQRVQSERRHKNKYLLHLERTIRVSMNTRSKSALYTFFLISGILFFLALLFCIESNQPFLISLVVCGMFGSAPYLFLILRLRSIQVTGSYEADVIITELISQYKLNYLNMIEAIDQTILRLHKHLHTRKALFRLSLDLKESQSKEDIEEITNEFAFSLGTEWGKLLANNIYQAVANRDDVRAGLEDILDELIALKTINEKNKQENSEGFFMIKYVAPVSFFVSVYAIIDWFGFGLEKYIEYQFRNSQGLQYFVFIVAAIILNYFIYYFVRKPKNDF